MLLDCRCVLLRQRQADSLPFAIICLLPNTKSLYAKNLLGRVVILRYLVSKRFRVILIESGAQFNPASLVYLLVCVWLKGALGHRQRVAILFCVSSVTETGKRNLSKGFTCCYRCDPRPRPLRSISVVKSILVLELYLLSIDKPLEN